MVKFAAPSARRHRRTCLLTLPAAMLMLPPGIGALLSVAGCHEARTATVEPVRSSAAGKTIENSAPAIHSLGGAALPLKGYATVGPLVVEQQADVVAERDGIVTAIQAEIGDRVSAGQVLARLDDRLLQAERARKAATLDSLRAQVSEWEAEQRSNEADLRRADAMRAEHILSEENWEHVRYKLDETIAEVARYKADVQAADADLRSADLELAKSRILAPFAGVVGRRSVHLAQEVKQGEALFWVTAEGPLHIVFTVPESEMALFHPGARLDLTTADYPGLEQPARVLHVSPVVDPASGSIEVVGALEHASPLLKPGMSMQVRSGAP